MTVAAGSMRRFSFVWLQYGDFFVCRCGVCVLCCCVLLFEIPGVSNAKAAFLVLFLRGPGVMTRVMTHTWVSFI